MQYLGIIYLNEFSFSDVKNELPDRYKSETEKVRKAYDYLVSNNLRYNAKTGYTRDCDGHKSNYSDSNDIPNYSMLNLYEILSDQFIPWINNSISRQLRGFDI